MHHEYSTEHTSMHCGSIPDVWEYRAQIQKKKIIEMKLDMKIQWMETNIKDMESPIEIKIRAIADVRKVQKMIKQGK
ncbi:hypothetical protein BGV40_16115 [Methanosarcina sp. Ant1]|nr:hypothetical protein BGV40_16115 [Methanosarcina sp. Ant1]